MCRKSTRRVLWWTWWKVQICVPSSWLIRARFTLAPAMMLALLLYGYATGILASRKLEEASRDSLALRFVCDNHHPDHSTIGAFRKRLRTFFAQVLRMAMKMGLTKLSAVTLDGSNIGADASKHKALSWKRAKALEQHCQKEANSSFIWRRKRTRVLWQQR